MSGKKRGLADRLLAELVFRVVDVPRAIRADNGSPFATADSLFGLTKLSVWWLRLGIDIERIKPGHPQKINLSQASQVARSVSRSAENLQRESVTHVSGIKRYPCNRNRQAS